jgi:ribosomal protein L32
MGDDQLTRKVANPRALTRRALLAACVILISVTARAAFGAVPTVHAQENPRLASLEIGIWPEFDRQAMALVILSGQFGDEVPLPATVAVHMPASSGGPAAVAFVDPESDTLLAIDYDLTAAKDSLLVTFTIPDPLFQIEFYDSLSIDTSNRSYTYVWPGDLATDDLFVEVQEPADATDLSVDPDLGDRTVSPNQLEYRSASMGPLEAGKTLAVNLTYAKPDLRTSVEILGDGGADASTSQLVDSGSGVPTIAIVAAIVGAILVALALMAGAVVYWRSRRRSATAPATSAPAAQPRAKAFCSQCGEPLLPGHRFCPQCGTPAKTG